MAGISADAAGCAATPPNVTAKRTAGRIGKCQGRLIANNTNIVGAAKQGRRWGWF
jgi:hypothetical protein